MSKTLSPFHPAVKRAMDPATAPFADAVQSMASGQLQSDALKDVRNIGLATLGAGAAGRGLIGLLQLVRDRQKKTRSGPAYLPLPYPAQEEKVGGFLDGDAATTKGGIPWYGPAMMLGGLAGLGGGWKGMDALLARRRKREMTTELETARQQFHDALLGQYEEPVKMHPELMKKKSGDETMTKVGEALDALYDRTVAEMGREAEAPAEKTALDMSNLAGQAAGGYGIYAGLTGLLTGALMYDRISKRSRRSILDKALQKRQRRRFAQQPTEIYAQSEPVEMPEKLGAEKTAISPGLIGKVFNGAVQKAVRSSATGLHIPAAKAPRLTSFAQKATGYLEKRLPQGPVGGNPQWERANNVTTPDAVSGGHAVLSRMRGFAVPKTTTPPPAAPAARQPLPPTDMVNNLTELAKGWGRARGWEGFKAFPADFRTAMPGHLQRTYPGATPAHVEQAMKTMFGG